MLSIYYKDRIEQWDEELDELKIRRLGQSILRLNPHFGKKKLGEMSTELVNSYVSKRGSKGGSRRDLENLRAAINHHASENLHHAVISVKLPEKGAARERWLTRSEAAHLIWTCWRYREEQTISRGKNKGTKIKTNRFPLRHVARFILIGLYSGTRAAAIASASIHRGTGKSYVDLDECIYYRLAIGARQTNKRQPPVPIPDRLIAHMRRWVEKKIVASHFVEWNGAAVKSVTKGFETAVGLAELDLTVGNVTPHTLRHTAATWLMQQGVELWQASGYLGMTDKTLIANYGHHHPDFMQDAAVAITKKRERTRSKMVRPTARQSL